MKACQNYHDMYLEYYYYRTMHFLNVHGQASENCWDADKRNAKYLIKKKNVLLNEQNYKKKLRTIELSGMLLELPLHLDILHIEMHFCAL